MPDDSKYLVLIKLGGDGPMLDRIRSAAPFVQSTLSSISRNDMQLAFSSDDGGTFGFLVNTGLNAGQIKSRLENPGTDGGTELTRDDSVMALEFGEDTSWAGFTRAGTWLQHH